MNGRSFLLLTIFVFVVAQIVAAQIPPTLSYQGRLTDSNGNNVPDGSYSLTFRLYSVSSAGTPLWSETHPSVSVTGGVFSAVLGSVTPIALPFEQQYWLGMSVAGGPELSPRTMLTASPYSIRSLGVRGSENVFPPSGNVGIGTLSPSSVIETVTPLNAYSYVHTNGTIRLGTYLNSTFSSGMIGTISNHPFQIYTSNAGPVLTVSAGGSTSGNVGIGTTSPGTKLDVVGGAIRGNAGLTITSGAVSFPAGSIGNSNLANSSLTVSAGTGLLGGGAVSLGGSTTLSLNLASANNWTNTQTFSGGVAFPGSGIWNTSGAVGIGTTTPGTFFDVIFPYSSNINPMALFRSTGAGSAAAVRFQNASNNIFNIGLTSTGDFAFNTANISQANDLLRITSTGNVGIGTTTPAYRLHVLNATGGARTLHAENNYVGTSDGIGVYGRSVNGDGYGYGGYFEGGFVGVRASASAGAYTGSAWGVYGIATGTAGTRYGVYGITSGGTTQYAGYFAGNVTVTGTLSKAGGSFKIDHPLDPANKYLVHSFVESPDMMNVYNGNVTLGPGGEAVVQLPAYFESLNKDFRYQLTAIGRPGPNLYIAEKIQNNRFKIAGGEPGMEVSWQVTGVRKDAWAERNRVQVEVEKSPEERGSYLHPEVFGLSRERAVPSLRESPLRKLPQE